MEKNLTELVFILDKSGSMSGKEEDTIGSFNSTINSNKDQDYDVLVTTVLFSDDHHTLHDRIDINEITPMDKRQYVANGSTALIDTIGDTIEHIKTIHKYQRRKEDIPTHTIFFIITDGLENASHKYSSDDVKKMIEQQKEYGWEFIFMGANIDAVETAKSLSIEESRAINYINDRKGIRNAYDFSGKFVKTKAMMDKGEVLCDSVMYSLREEVDEDYKKRGNKKTKH